MSAPLIFNGRRAKMLTQDGILRADGSIIDNNGVPNLVKNGHAEINVTGWTVSKNTVAASRPDSGFVTSSTNITWTRNTTNPIDGQADFLYTKDAANRQGEQVYCGFTVAKKHRAKVLQIEVDYLVNSGTFSAGSSSTDSDIIVYIYDVTNSTFIEPSSFKFLSSSSTIADKFVANFKTSATGSSYRILFHQATTSASAFAVQFKEVRISPCNYVYGTPITAWQSYTPTFTGFGTVSAVNIQSRRVGDSLEVQGRFTSGTSTATGAKMTLGYGGANGNVTSKSTIGNVTLVGEGGFNVVAAAKVQLTIAPSSSDLLFGIQDATRTGVNNVNGSSLTTSGDVVFVNALIPIEGWSSSTQQSDSYTARDIVAIYRISADKTPSVSSPIDFDTKIQDTTASVTTGSGWKFTAPKSSFYDVTVTAATSTTGGTLDLYVNGSQDRGLMSMADTSVRSASASIYLRAGDYISVNPDSASKTFTGTKNNTIYIRNKDAPTTMSATEVVAARYYLASNTAFSTGTVQVPYDTKVYDTHGAYSTSTFKFTAPVAGFYRITITFNTTASLTETVAYRIDATTSYYLGTASSVGRFNGSDTFYLNAGQTVEPMSAGSGGTYAGGATGTFFTIERIK